MFLRYITILIFVFVTTILSLGDRKLEKEFINKGQKTGNKIKTWPVTVFANWTEDRKYALCERALNDSKQFEDGRFLPKVMVKEIIFRHEKHYPVNVTVLKCPTAFKKYLYESPRELDCYLMFTEEPATRLKRNDSIFIEKEVCEIGLM